MHRLPTPHISSYACTPGRMSPAMTAASSSWAHTGTSRSRKYPCRTWKAASSDCRAPARPCLVAGTPRRPGRPGSGSAGRPRADADPGPGDDLPHRCVDPETDEDLRRRLDQHRRVAPSISAPAVGSGDQGSLRPPARPSMGRPTPVSRTSSWGCPLPTPPVSPAGWARRSSARRPGQLEQGSGQSGP